MAVVITVGAAVSFDVLRPPGGRRAPPPMPGEGRHGARQAAEWPRWRREVALATGGLLCFAGLLMYFVRDPISWNPIAGGLGLIFSGGIGGTLLGIAGRVRPQD